MVYRCNDWSAWNLVMLNFQEWMVVYDHFREVAEQTGSTLQHYKIEDSKLDIAPLTR